MSAYLKEVRRETFCAETHATVVDGGSVTLDAEELEPVIAPGHKYNHGGAFVEASVELAPEELELVIAPGYRYNHNETLLAGR